MITHIQLMHPTARTPRVIRSVELSAFAHGGNEIHNPSNTQYVPNSAAERQKLEYVSGLCAGHGVEVWALTTKRE